MSLKNIKNIKHLENNNFFLIAGPCAVETEEICFEIAEKAKAVTDKLGIPYIFKASFKKAIVLDWILLPELVMKKDWKL